MDEVEFGSKTLPRLLCGSSPFMGAGQFGRKGIEWYKRFFNSPEKMAEIFTHFADLGFPGIHVIAYPSILEAAKLANKESPLKITISLLPNNWVANLESVAVLEPEVIFVHGAMTDQFLNQRFNELAECLQMIRDHGAFPGIASHNPFKTLGVLKSTSNPLNQESLGLLLPFNPTGFSMDAPLQHVINLVQLTDDRHPIMAMKVLAAGKLNPYDALRFVFGHSQVKAATIGMVNKEQALEIALIGSSFSYE